MKKIKLVNSVLKIKTKACIAERFNRTIEEEIEKVLTEDGNNNWISILPALMINYNNSRHRSIKMTLFEASKKENTELVYANLFPKDVKNDITKKLNTK